MTTAQDASAALRFTLSVAEDFHLSRFVAPWVAKAAVPGQFVSLKVGAGTSPLLRLPLSLFATDPAAGTIDVLYERRGPKTSALCQLRPGTSVPCLGPLGNGFPEPEKGTLPLLVGGGIGLPPLIFLGRRWRSSGRRGAVLLAGARHRDKHLTSAVLAEGADRVHQATDDGSLGHSGLVTDLLARHLAHREPCTVYTCGPHAMMAVVAAKCAAAGVLCHVSLESYMACGFGVCVGCVVERAGAARGRSYEKYARVCMDGPVFEASQVVW